MPPGFHTPVHNVQGASGCCFYRTPRARNAQQKFLWALGAVYPLQSFAASSGAPAPGRLKRPPHRLPSERDIFSI